MNFGQILQKIEHAVKPFANEGKISTSIPELSLVDPAKFGIHLVNTQKADFAIGDSNEKFSIQSLS